MDDPAESSDYDLAIIGGGINGCGIARDAAGRGWRVFLCDKADLGSGTSSASTKLIHGGLRYLEYYAFRLVREALMEREVLWGIAPHIIWPMRFVLPHHRRLRPAWLLRLGLFLYDHLGGRKRLPADADPGSAQRPGGRAAEARIHPRLRIFGLLGGGFAPGRAERARRGRSGGDDRAADRMRVGGAGRWPLDGYAARRTDGPAVDDPGPALVNAAGPWVAEVSEGVIHTNVPAPIRLVQGSHIVVPQAV